MVVDWSDPEWEYASLGDCAITLRHIAAADPTAPPERRQSFKTRAPADVVTSVYRMWDSRGDLLYVGVTCRHGDRIHEHLLSKPWFKKVAEIEWEEYPCRLDAMFAEAEAINRERPRYNKQIPAPRWWVKLPQSVEKEQRESLDKQAQKHFGMTGDELLHMWRTGDIAKDDDRLFVVSNLLAAVMAQDD